MSNQLQYKLLHYEVPPPKGAWNKIISSLDANVSLPLSEKLYKYEEDPSQLAWQNISVQLDSSIQEQAKIIPFYVRYRRPLKYSSAVAVFIFIAVLTSLFISKKTESELPAQGVSNLNIIKNDSSKSPDISKEGIVAARLAKNNKPEHLIAKSKVSRIGQDKFQNLASSSLAVFLPQQAERNEIVNSTISSDKYMIYSDVDGNVIRLPKKIFNAFACPPDDISCKLRLQELKEKFAASAMTTDFTGLLQILKSLQENQ